MSWEPELEELRRREELARRMGGEERVERQHESGRLTVRERIERLFDEGTFHETGALAGRGTYGDDGELTELLPANTIVGQGRIDGRRTVVQGDDFTVRGGAADAAIWEKAVYAERLAHDLRLPLVRLVDGTGGGGSVKTLEQMGFSYVPPLPGFDLVVKNLAIVPVAAAALGPVAGLGAARVVCSHFSVIVKGTAQLFVAGPPVVAMAGMGESPDKEELGGARLQTRAGAVDNLADDEDDAVAQLKRFLSYLPDNVWEAPPHLDASDPADRREDSLISVVPRDPRQPYNMRHVLDAVLDRGSTFELGAAFGRPTITCLARLGGRPVGVLASDPEHYGGGVTADAAEKTARFVDMCDQFHLPVVNFVDVPGFVIGTDAERAGTIRRGSRGLFAAVQATVPWVSILVRKVYGVAGAGHGDGSRLNLRFAWPSGNWGSLPMAGRDIVARAMKLNGIHHITAITGDSQRNVDFYVGVMGLRLVKKSVNQDDPTVYHLFYGDEHAKPGLDLTFFEYPGAAPGRAGEGMVHRVVWRVGSPGALDFWSERLAGAGVETTREGNNLLFRDPEGLEHELVVADVPDEPLIAEHPEVPAEHALQGFHAARAYASDPGRSRTLLEEGLGFQSSGEGWEARGDERGGLYFYDAPPAERGIQGAGTVHHVAWNSADEDHEAWRDRAAQSGAHPTQVIDRHYFKSIYFREPSGVLFELATPSPGFTIDEPLETLGEKLSIPPKLEELREQIEATVRPLENPRTAARTHSR